MKRQSMGITTGQLRKLANQLDKELMEIKGVNVNPETVGHQINIINKMPECSDTWEIEE